jgi:hypothetical protein
MSSFKIYNCFMEQMTIENNFINESNKLMWKYYC